MPDGRGVLVGRVHFCGTSSLLTLPHEHSPKSHARLGLFARTSRVFFLSRHGMGRKGGGPGRISFTLFPPTHMMLYGDPRGKDSQSYCLDTTTRYEDETTLLTNLTGWWRLGKGLGKGFGGGNRFNSGSLYYLNKDTRWFDCGWPRRKPSRPRKKWS